MNPVGEYNHLGIGVDIENIDRFTGPGHTRNRAFLKKIFTRTEQRYCFSKATTAPHLAAKYAGKEAIIKALTSIGRQNTGYSNIEIINNKNGVPEVRISEAGFDDLQMYLSLSHCADKAIAFAIITKEKGYLPDCLAQDESQRIRLLVQWHNPLPGCIH